MSLTNYLFGFRGRINRAKWWLFLILFVVYVAIVEWLIIPARIGFAVWSLVMAPLWFTAVAVGIKRLHDRNKGAAWALLLYGLPFLIWLYREYMTWASNQADLAMAQARTPEEMQAAAQAIQDAHQGMTAHLGSFGWILLAAELAVFIWVLIELGMLKGTTGDNQYGPDPLANVKMQ